MVFISGIHGVGKTFFCNLLKEKYNIDCFSASTLISEKRKMEFSSDKFVLSIDKNHLFLLDAVNDLKALKKEFLLDGHFCLLNNAGKITRIPISTFIDLEPDVIVLLTEDPAIILERRFVRDGISQSIEEIELFQKEEIKYAKEVACQLHIPLLVSYGSKDIDSIIEFIMNRE